MRAGSSKKATRFSSRFSSKGARWRTWIWGGNCSSRSSRKLWPVSKIERDAKMEGRRMTLVLQPDHKQPGAKPPGAKGAGATGPAAGSGPRPSPMAAGARLNIPVPPPAAAAPKQAPEPAVR